MPKLQLSIIIRRAKDQDREKGLAGEEIRYQLFFVEALLCFIIFNRTVQSSVLLKWENAPPRFSYTGKLQALFPSSLVYNRPGGNHIQNDEVILASGFPVCVMVKQSVAARTCASVCNCDTYLKEASVGR